MIKGILFDWHGVLVESNDRDKDSNSNDKKRIDFIYNKLKNNTATK